MGREVTHSPRLLNDLRLLDTIAGCELGRNQAVVPSRHVLDQEVEHEDSRERPFVEILKQEAHIAVVKVGDASGLRRLAEAELGIETPGEREVFGWPKALISIARKDTDCSCCLTFDMSGDRKLAKRACGRPLDGGLGATGFGLSETDVVLRTR